MNHEVQEEMPASEFRMIARPLGGGDALSEDFAHAFSDALTDILRAESSMLRKTKA
jgi:hypothetical protein